MVVWVWQFWKYSVLTSISTLVRIPAVRKEYNLESVKTRFSILEWNQKQQCERTCMLRQFHALKWHIKLEPGYLPQVFFCLIFEPRFVTEPRAHQFSRLATKMQESSCLLTSSVLGLWEHNVTHGFLCGCWESSTLACTGNTLTNESISLLQ